MFISFKLPIIKITIENAFQNPVDIPEDVSQVKIDRKFYEIIRFDENLNTRFYIFILFSSVII